MQKKEKILSLFEEAIYFRLQSLLMSEMERAYLKETIPLSFDCLDELNKIALAKIDKYIEKHTHLKNYCLIRTMAWETKKNDLEILRADLLQLFWWYFQFEGYLATTGVLSSYFKIPARNLKDLLDDCKYTIIARSSEKLGQITHLYNSYSLSSLTPLYNIEDYFVDLYINYYFVFHGMFRDYWDVYQTLEGVLHIAPIQGVGYNPSKAELWQKNDVQQEFLIDLKVPMRQDYSMIDSLQNIFMELITGLAERLIETENLKVQLILKDELEKIAVYLDEVIHVIAKESLQEEKIMIDQLYSKTATMGIIKAAAPTPLKEKIEIIYHHLDKIVDAFEHTYKGTIKATSYTTLDDKIKKIKSLIDEIIKDIECFSRATLDEKIARIDDQLYKARGIIDVATRIKLRENLKEVELEFEQDFKQLRSITKTAIQAIPQDKVELIDARLDKIIEGIKVAIQATLIEKIKRINIQLDQAIDITTQLTLLQKRNKYPLTQRKTPLKALEALLLQHFNKANPKKSVSDFMNYLAGLFKNKGYNVEIRKDFQRRINIATKLRSARRSSDDLTLIIDIESSVMYKKLRKWGEFQRQDKREKVLDLLEKNRKIEIPYGSIRKNQANIFARFKTYKGFSGSEESEKTNTVEGKEGSAEVQPTSNSSQFSEINFELLAANALNTDEFIAMIQRERL